MRVRWVTHAACIRKPENTSYSGNLKTKDLLRDSSTDVRIILKQTLMKQDIM
jgi:hypothetical protein